MGYSTSPATLAKIRPQLTELESGKPCKWQTKPGENGKLAYKIIEALHIAKLYAGRYPKLAHAANTFQIRKVGLEWVVAEHKDVPVLSVSQLHNPNVPSTAEQIPSVQQVPDIFEVDEEPEEPISSAETGLLDVPTLALPTPTITGPQNQFGIIGAWEQNPGARAVFFPEAALTDKQLRMLYTWCENQQPKMMLLVADDSAGITLALHDPDMEGIYWTPED